MPSWEQPHIPRGLGSGGGLPGGMSGLCTTGNILVKQVSFPILPYLSPQHPLPCSGEEGPDSWSGSFSGDNLHAENQ